ncbi:DUF3862 domain-containing protein [Candidatus Enterococcus murrayae]|uniref:DUF3862 domain-containing protein n=1 Tax=Candidatus Enterococcus murrayae TaxID=2815321 RepID=A0ABS3HGG1_9ENTE|nr:DUF3862 domain-containing protein [Enterococcus sp. MJM16]MBO0452548.1 DUF3862 domain-containing protein [Enterococcus sp. MJM16]
MRKKNVKLVNNLLIVTGVILVCFAAVLYGYLNVQKHDPVEEPPTTTSTKALSSDEERVNTKVDSLKELRQIIEKIDVGEDENGKGGTKKAEIEKMLGKPNSKMEDYQSGEKAVTYAWNNFPWKDPFTSVLITFRDGKVISTMLDVFIKDKKNLSDFLDHFNQIAVGEAYEKAALIEKLGYPTSEMVQKNNDHTYEYYTWSDSNKIFSIELKDGKIKERKQHEY